MFFFSTFFLKFNDNLHPDYLYGNLNDKRPPSSGTRTVSSPRWHDDPCSLQTRCRDHFIAFGTAAVSRYATATITSEVGGRMGLESLMQLELYGMFYLFINYTSFFLFTNDYN
jgi:hypothetical protein